MSTRCRIGLEMPDGTIKSIYCHHDGYLGYVGKMLQKHYQDAEKVAALVELGDISSLHETVEETAPEAYKNRNEETPARIDKTEFDFWANAGKCGEEFVYLLGIFEDYHGEKSRNWEVLEVPYPRNLDEAIAELDEE